MGDRSVVSKENDDGSYRSIYVHWAGPKLLALLEECYGTEEKVDLLLDRGDMSSVHKTPQRCEAYADRGETGVEAEIILNQIDLIKYERELQDECSFLFKDGKWRIRF